MAERRPTDRSSEASRRRRSPGRRVQAQRRRRRRARTRTTLAVGALAITALVVLVAALGLGDRARELVAPADEDEAEADEKIVSGEGRSLLVVVTLAGETDDADAAGGRAGESDGGGEHTPASTVSVLSVDRDRGQGTVLLVPTTTVAEVPGYGAFPLGEAHAFGGAELVEITLANLLGVPLDGVVTLDRDGWRSLARMVGPVEVDVPDAVAGEDGLRLAAGSQRLDPDQLAELVTIAPAPGDELDAMGRVQAALTGLLEGAPGSSEAFASLEEVEDEMTGLDEGADRLGAVLDDLAALLAVDEATALTLPVSPLGSGGDDLYRVDDARLAELVGTRLGVEAPSPDEPGRDVHVLNGKGEPGIGRHVARELAGGEYEIVLSGNADRFGRETTRILVHDDSPEAIERARDVRDRLGVGEVVRAGTPQSVADLTIVVGTDFPPRGDADPG